MNKIKINKFFKSYFHSSFFQYVALVTATFNIICSGLYIGWPTPTLPQLLSKNSTIPTTDDEGSWIATTFFIGGICGALLSAIILDRLGRRLVILLTSGPFLMSWLLIAFTNSVTVLLIARFIAGISDGMVFCSVPVYLAEISEPKIRGFIGSSITVANFLGMISVNIIGSHLSITTTALLSSATPILLLVTFFWMPESPYYLVMKGKLEQARTSLMFFRGHGQIDDEINRLTIAINEQNENSGKFLDLFKVKSNRRAIYTIMGARFGQQFSGSLAIMLYTQIIFKEVSNDVTPETASLIYYSVQLVSALICTSLVDKFGRKPLMIISLVGIIITLVIDGCYFYMLEKTNIPMDDFNLIPVIVLLIFVAMFGIGMYTIPLLLISEMFPTNVRAFAVSFSDVYFCIISSVAIKFFQFTKDGFGLYVPFFVFAICEVLSLIFTVVYIPETKGKTLEEIQDVLKGNR